MSEMLETVFLPTYEEYQRGRYIEYIETLGTNVDFNNDKWICDKKKRNFTEGDYFVTIYFTKVKPRYKEMVKYFAAIRLLQGVGIRVVKTNVFSISEFLDYIGDNLLVDYNTAAGYKSYLDSLDLSEVTLHGKWSSVNKFLEIMNGYEGHKFKMVFAENPYDSHKKHDYKYIPDNVVEQLDEVFYSADIDETVRCIYWVLRLIPSRISEVLNMKIDSLKPYNGHYCLFIPSWKQNGGRREPIMRCIHIEDEGIGGYLIGLIKKQQQMADEFQKYMPESSKGALFTYRIINHMSDGSENLTNQYRVIKWPTISKRLSAICRRYNITDEYGKIYKVTTHQFRHNGITDRLESGFTVEQITDMTGHHGSTMLLDAYSHLNLKPETITKVQNSVIDEIERDYSVFNGQVLDMDEATEREIMKNMRAHKVRGGICSDITGCKSDMMNCLECKFFLPDQNQMEYYKEQIELWRQKAERFKSIHMIRANAEKNMELYKIIVEKMENNKYMY